jgi:hypothetical protein
VAGTDPPAGRTWIPSDSRQPEGAGPRGSAAGDAGEVVRAAQRARAAEVGLPPAVRTRGTNAPGPATAYAIGTNRYRSDDIECARLPADIYIWCQDILRLSRKHWPSEHAQIAIIVAQYPHIIAWLAHHAASPATEEALVKFTARAAIAALIAITATGPALVPLAGPALASSTPPTAARGLLGTWANTDPATRDVMDIVVTAKARGIMVDAFASCTPKSCEWGKIPGTVFGADVNSVTGHSFEANWDFRFVRDVFLATLTRPRGVPTLVVKEFKTFVDPGSRANYAKVETFVRAGRPIIPTLSGKAGHGYPAGHWVKPCHPCGGPGKAHQPGAGSGK